MRTRRQVIGIILATLGTEDHIGLSMEPIAAAVDPNVIEMEDYQVRVIFEVPCDDTNKCLAAVYTATLPMLAFQQMDEARFDRNIDHLLKSLAGYKQAIKDKTGAGAAMRITADGVILESGDVVDSSIGAVAQGFDEVLKKAGRKPQAR